MNKNTERIDHYLRNVDLPEPASGSHRHELRRQVLNEIERRRSMSVGNKTWKVALAIAAVVGGGAMATAVSVKLYRYHFEGQDADGRYIFRTAPEVTEGVEGDPNGTETYVSTTRQSTVSMRPEGDDETSAEQMQADLEEIDQLREQGARQLLRVIDEEVGERFSRVCVFEYELSDGRTMAMAENDRSHHRPGPRLTDSQREELKSAVKAGAGEIVSTYEEDIDGQVFAFERRRHVLSDGTEVMRSEGLPKSN
jgi:hypothetical protein